MLSAQQKRFVREYLVDLNGGAAAIRAGYSANGAYAAASRMLRNVNIAEAIQKAMDKRGERTEINADRVLRELARVAFSDIRLVAKWDKNGVQHIASDEIDDDTSAAIMEVNHKQTLKVRRGEDGKAEKATILNREQRVKLHDKMKALDLLGRHLGMFGREATLPPTTSLTDANPISFEEFCDRASYPKPFPKQCEMRAFVFDDESNTTRLLLGSRGYGKTDYVTILGTAYAIYLNCNIRVLILTKSDDRNKAIIAEIEKALAANGVKLQAATTHHLRAVGLHGKDHSVEALTVGSNAVRGHHPDITLLDDPVTEEDVSEATRRRLERKYNELVKLVANIVLIGQPVHVFDLYQTLRPIVKVMEVPHGTIPELDHDLVAMQLAGVSETSISASYHLKVSSETGNPLSNVQWLDEFPAGDSVAFIDPSFKGGDYTAMSVARKYFDGVAVEGYAWKKSWDACLDDIAKVCESLNVRRLGFECNSLGTMPLPILRAALKGVGVTGKDSTGHKHSRIMAAGTVAKYIHLSKKSMRIYIDQVTKYEYGSKFDDSPDSLASLLEWIGLIKGKK